MEDESIALRLVERLLSCSQPLGTLERAQLLPGKLPDLPVGLLLPPNSSIVASIDRNHASKRRWIEVLFEHEGQGIDRHLTTLTDPNPPVLTPREFYALLVDRRLAPVKQWPS